MSTHSQRSRAESDTGVTRKLEEVGRAVDSMRTRDDLPDFLDNPGNAQKLNGLVEDIRHALIEYMVSTPKCLTLIASNVCLRHPYKETSATRTANQL